MPKVSFRFRVVPFHWANSVRLNPCNSGTTSTLVRGFLFLVESRTVYLSWAFALKPSTSCKEDQTHCCTVVSVDTALQFLPREPFSWVKGEQKVLQCFAVTFSSRPNSICTSGKGPFFTHLKDLLNLLASTVQSSFRENSTGR